MAFFSPETGERASDGKKVAQEAGCFQQPASWAKRKRRHPAGVAKALTHHTSPGATHPGDNPNTPVPALTGAER